MNDLSSAAFNVVCEIGMAADILQMVVDRRNEDAPETGGVHAALVLLKMAKDNAEKVESMACKVEP